MDNKNNKNYSDLGKYVRDWKEGMRLDKECLVEFAIQSNIKPDKTFTKSEIQSLVSRYLNTNKRNKRNKEKKEQKEQKETEKIDETPPTDQEEQDQAHGGDEDQHKDIEDADDMDNDSNTQEDGTTQESDTSQETNNNNNNNNNENNNKNNGDASNSSNAAVEQTLQSNIEKNEQIQQQLQQLQQLQGEIDDRDRDKSMVQKLMQNTSREIGYGGGGRRMDDAKDADLTTFRLIQQFLVKLASDPSPMGKEDGEARWDPVKLIKSRFNAGFNNAKFSRPKERNIWFIVDNSGSVSQFAEFIISMIQGASNVVKVVMGSEAKPTHLLDLPKVNRPKALKLRDLYDHTVWEQDFKKSFLVCLKTFLKECNVRRGDILVFWGDLMDALESETDTPHLFRKLLRGYKCYWLLSHDGTKRYRNNHTSIIEESKAFKIFYEVYDALTLRQIIKKIK
jgi:hypothetical protein